MLLLLLFLVVGSESAAVTPVSLAPPLTFPPQVHCALAVFSGYLTSTSDPADLPDNYLQCGWSEFADYNATLAIRPAQIEYNPDGYTAPVLMQDCNATHCSVNQVIYDVAGGGKGTHGAPVRVAGFPLPEANATESFCVWAFPGHSGCSAIARAAGVVTCTCAFVDEAVAASAAVDYGFSYDSGVPMEQIWHNDSCADGLASVTVACGPSAYVCYNWTAEAWGGCVTPSAEFIGSYVRTQETENLLPAWEGEYNMADGDIGCEQLFPGLNATLLEYWGMSRCDTDNDMGIFRPFTANIMSQIMWTAEETLCNFAAEGCEDELEWDAGIPGISCCGADLAQSSFLQPESPCGNGIMAGSFICGELGVQCFNGSGISPCYPLDQALAWGNNLPTGSNTTDLWVTVPSPRPQINCNYAQVWGAEANVTDGVAYCDGQAIKPTTTAACSVLYPYYCQEQREGIDQYAALCIGTYVGTVVHCQALNGTRPLDEPMQWPAVGTPLYVEETAYFGTFGEDLPWTDTLAPLEPSLFYNNLTKAWCAMVYPGLECGHISYPVLNVSGTNITRWDVQCEQCTPSAEYEDTLQNANGTLYGIAWGEIGTPNVVWDGLRSFAAGALACYQSYGDGYVDPHNPMLAMYAYSESPDQYNCYRQCVVPQQGAPCASPVGVWESLSTLQSAIAASYYPSAIDQIPALPELLPDLYATYYFYPEYAVIDACGVGVPVQPDEVLPDRQTECGGQVPLSEGCRGIFNTTDEYMLLTAYDMYENMAMCVPVANVSALYEWRPIRTAVQTAMMSDPGITLCWNAAGIKTQPVFYDTYFTCTAFEMPPVIRYYASFPASSYFCDGASGPGVMVLECPDMGYKCWNSTADAWTGCLSNPNHHSNPEPPPVVPYTMWVSPGTLAPAQQCSYAQLGGTISTYARSAAAADDVFMCAADVATAGPELTVATDPDGYVLVSPTLATNDSVIGYFVASSGAAVTLDSERRIVQGADSLAFTEYPGGETAAFCAYIYPGTNCTGIEQDDPSTLRVRCTGCNFTDQAVFEAQAIANGFDPAVVRAGDIPWAHALFFSSAQTLCPTPEPAVATQTYQCTVDQFVCYNWTASAWTGCLDLPETPTVISVAGSQPLPLWAETYYLAAAEQYGRASLACDAWGLGGDLQASPWPDMAHCGVMDERLFYPSWQTQIVDDPDDALCLWLTGLDADELGNSTLGPAEFGSTWVACNGTNVTFGQFIGNIYDAASTGPRVQTTNCDGDRAQYWNGAAWDCLPYYDYGYGVMWILFGSLAGVCAVFAMWWLAYSP